QGNSPGELRDTARVDGILNGYKVEASGLGVQPKNRGQHENRSDHGVQKELDRGIHLPSMTIHADQQRHRDERGFPEEIKQEQIQGSEDTYQAGLKYQKQNEEFFDAIVN